jgi:hypothetical protein
MEILSAVRAFFGDLVDWAVALVRRVWYFLGSVVIGGAIFIIEHVSGSSIPWKWILLIIGVGFVLSVFTTWRAEHRARLALETSDPKFVGEISMVSTFDTDQPGVREFLHPYKHAILASGWIRNDGGPSYIRSWTASGVDEAGLKLRGHVMYPPKTTLTYNAIDQREQTISVEYNEMSSLLRRSGGTLQKYQRESGVIVVGFEARVNPLSLRLGFDDRNETWYSVGIIARPEAPMP